MLKAKKHLLSNHNSFFNIKKHQRQLKTLFSSGQTPAFVSQKDLIVRRYQQLNQALESQYEAESFIAYSCKTNYPLIKVFNKLDSFMEVVSASELERVLALKVKPSKVVFNGPLKPPLVLQKSLNQGVIVHLDNQAELDSLLDLKLGSNYRLGMRLNFSSSSSHFGFRFDKQAIKAVDQLIKSQINITSLHLHLGTDVNQLKHYQKAAKMISRFANHLYQTYQLKLKFLDLGGGFPAHGLKPYSQKKWQPHPIEKYVSVISKTIKKLILYQPLPSLILEPGRFLVDDSTVFICKVIDVQRNLDNQVLKTDGSTTMLPLSFYRPQIVNLYSSDFKPMITKIVKTGVYGASCQSNDCLYKGQLPQANLDDYLVFFSTGAYNYNLCPEFIFSKPNYYIL